MFISTRGFLIGLIPVAMIVAGVVIGWQEAKGDNSKKPVEVVDGAHILNILITDKRGERIFDPEMYEEHELTYVVQVALPNGQKREFETAGQLLNHMGEGMKGRATFQGNWLNNFEPAQIQTNHSHY